MTEENAKDGSRSESEFERETRIRDLYVSRLPQYRPNERLIDTESGFKTSGCRADFRTVDVANLIRMYEVKLRAGYEALGQILVYVGLAREESSFDREIRGVIAAFSFAPGIRRTVSVMNLGIELVTLPPHLARAGGVPLNSQSPQLPKITRFIA